MNPFTNHSAAERPAVVAEIERRFAANPELAAEFDAMSSRSRREKIIATLDFIGKVRSEHAAIKAAVAAKRQKLSALENARTAHAGLKSSLAAANARVATLATAQAARKAPTAVSATKPAPAPTAQAPTRRMMNPPPTAAAPIPQASTAPSGTITMDGFRALSPTDRMAFVKSGGKLSN
jgi:hypothetical protein